MTIAVATGTLDCDFEDGWCEYIQAVDDDFDWTRRSGATSSSGTGPSADHTIGTGNSLKNAEI